MIVDSNSGNLCLLLNRSYKRCKFLRVYAPDKNSTFLVNSIAEKICGKLLQCGKRSVCDKRYFNEWHRKK